MVDQKLHEKPPRVWGPEPWATIEGQAFVYWDLWYLALAVELGGLDALDAELKKRADGQLWLGHDIEAKLSHLADLRTRLAALDLTPEQAHGERPDTRLLRKATSKVLDQWVPEEHKTTPMLHTPRRRLRERAMRGHWQCFPVLPAKFEKAFLYDVGRQRCYNLGETCLLMQRLGARWKEASLEGRFSPAASLALHRAAMTVLVEAMECVDGSDNDVGILFDEVFKRYVRTPWISTGIDPEAYVRDAVELVVWEDYGLVDDTTPFFAGVPREHGSLVSGILASTLDELEQFGFVYEARKLYDVWAAFLVAHERFDEFVSLAQSIGADRWMPVVALANAAHAAGRLPLCRDIFSVTNRPGINLSLLAEHCRRLLGIDLTALRSARRIVGALPPRDGIGALMADQEPIEYALIKDATLLEFEVAETSIKPTVGNEDFHVVITLKTEDDVLDTCAMGLMFTLAVLSFHDARPRGVSGHWFEDDDQLSIADFLRGFEYHAGVLHYYGDYLRGRCLKTTIEVHPDGKITLETVNRGQAATRWIDRLKGKKLLKAV